MALAVGFPTAPPQTFDFKDPKGVNSVSWLLDSPIEPISGTAGEISGTLSFDPEHPEKTRGTIILQTKGLVAPVPLMTRALQSKDWMDAAKYPTVEFKVKKIELGEMMDERQGATVTGDLKMHGVTKEIEAPVEANIVKGGLSARMGGQMKGDVFRIRTEFRVKRSDFGIGGQFPSVGDEIELRCAFVGIRPEK